MPRDGKDTITVDAATKDQYREVKDDRTWDELLNDALQALIEKETPGTPDRPDSPAPVDDSLHERLDDMDAQLQRLAEQVDRLPRRTAETFDRQFGR